MQNVDKMTRNCLQWVLCYNLLRYCSLQFHSTRVPEIWKHLAECFFLCTSIHRLDYQPLFVYMFSKLLGMQSVHTSWMVSAFQTQWSVPEIWVVTGCMYTVCSQLTQFLVVDYTFITRQPVWVPGEQKAFFLPVQPRTGWEVRQAKSFVLALHDKDLLGSLYLSVCSWH